MKIEFVEVAGFRGFRDRTKFDLASGFNVISGRNGVGKSTLLDAVDFAITGSINKYAVSGMRGSGLSEHIWWVGSGRPAEHFVSVGFVDDDGARTTIRREPNDKSGPPAKLIAALCATGAEEASPTAILQTTLIRDELIAAASLDLTGQARFEAVRSAIGTLTGPDYTPRTDAILKEARASLAADEQRLRDVQRDFRNALEQLTDARSAAVQSSDVAAAMSLIEATVPADGSTPRAEAARAFLIDLKEKLSRLNEARSQASDVVAELEVLNSEDEQAAQAAASVAVSQAEAERRAASERVTQAEGAETSERGSDEFVAHLAILVEHGEALGLQSGHCPLCDAARTNQEFAAALGSIRSSLSGRAERLTAASETLRLARLELALADTTLSLAREKLEDFDNRRVILDLQRETLRLAYDAAGYPDLDVVDLNDAGRQAGELQQRIVALERALLVLDASGAAERVANLEARVQELRETQERAAVSVAEAEGAVETARLIDSSAKSVANEILMEQFDTVMPLVKELYRRLRPHTDWTEIDSDFGGKVRSTLNFTVGDGHNPQFLFSSGQRRAAGLAFLLAIHLSRPWCLWRSLLLDDPVQHVDDYRALNLVEVLAAIRRSGRQVVVAVEDSALADLLCRRLRSSVTEPGRRYDLECRADGAARVASVSEVAPMPLDTLRLAAAS